jgi:hypothetical protein
MVIHRRARFEAAKKDTPAILCRSVNWRRHPWGAGGRRDEAILGAIDRANALVILISGNANGSKHFKREFVYAPDRGRPIFSGRTAYRRDTRVPRLRSTARRQTPGRALV